MACWKLRFNVKVEGRLDECRVVTHMAWYLRISPSKQLQRATLALRATKSVGVTASWRCCMITPETSTANGTDNSCSSSASGRTRIAQSC